MLLLPSSDQVRHSSGGVAEPVVARAAPLAPVDGDRLVLVEAALDKVEHPDLAAQGHPGIAPVHIGEGLADEAGGDGHLTPAEARWKLGAGPHERDGAFLVLVETPLVAAVAGGASWDDCGTALQGRRQELDADGGDAPGWMGAPVAPRG